MTYEKQNFENGQILKAEHLNRMEEGIGAPDWEDMINRPFGIRRDLVKFTYDEENEYNGTLSDGRKLYHLSSDTYDVTKNMIFKSRVGVYVDIDYDAFDDTITKQVLPVDYDADSDTTEWYSGSSRRIMTDEGNEIYVFECVEYTPRTYEEIIVTLICWEMGDVDESCTFEYDGETITLPTGGWYAITGDGKFTKIYNEMIDEIPEKYFPKKSYRHFYLKAEESNGTITGELDGITVEELADSLVHGAGTASGYFLDGFYWLERSDDVNVITPIYRYEYKPWVTNVTIYPTKEDYDEGNYFTVNTSTGDVTYVAGETAE